MKRKFSAGILLLCLILPGAFLKLRYYIPTPKPSSKNRVIGNASVEAFSLKGDVRVKRAFSESFRQLNEGDLLFPGEQIFVGPGGYAHLEYISLGATLELGPYSIMTIGTTLPTMSKLIRKFSRPKLSNALSFPLSQNKKNTQSGTPAPISTTGVKLSRDVERLTILFPTENTLIFAKKYPFNISVQIESEFLKRPFWIYLWGDSSETKPLWSGFGQEALNRVQILRPGNYILQLAMEDESAVSKPISLQVKERSNSLSFLSEALMDKGKEKTVIIQ